MWFEDKWVEGSMGFNEIVPNNSLPPDLMIVTSFALSMIVNTLATGLIVIRILKVILEVNRASSSSLGATGGGKLGPVIFTIIESGMALFAIQLVRVVFSCLESLGYPTTLAFSLIIGTNQMFNVIYSFLFLIFY